MIGWRYGGIEDPYRNIKRTSEVSDHSWGHSNSHMTNKRKKPSTNKINIKRVGHGKDIISTEKLQSEWQRCNYYSRQYRNWCPHNAIRISAPRHINSWVAILMIHGIFFKFIVHREKTWRGSFLCTTTSPAPFFLFTELIAFMTYETKFGATARMNLGLIAGSLVTFWFLLFGILRLVENDLVQM